MSLRLVSVSGSGREGGRLVNLHLPRDNSRVEPLFRQEAVFRKARPWSGAAWQPGKGQQQERGMKQRIESGI